MSITVSRPQRTTVAERLIHASVPLFSAGMFAGMISALRRLGLWDTLVPKGTVAAAVFDQMVLLSGVLSVLLLGLGLVVLAVGAAVHQIGDRWGWT